MSALFNRPNRRTGGRAAAVLACLVLGSAALLTQAARAEIIVRLEVTLESLTVHLEPDSRSPIVETLPRGTVVKRSSAMKFRTSWVYIQFVSSRSGRTLTGYVPETCVRQLNSTLKVMDLSPARPEIADPKEFDLERLSLPDIQWGLPEAGILRAEGRPLSRDASGDMGYLCYHRDVLGKRCLLTYVMIDRRLASIRVHLLERYANKDRYVADYHKIRDFLNAKVGEPRYDNIVWKDRAYADRGEPLGTAVTSGSLSLSSEWAYRGTGLRLSLTAENSEILFDAEISELRPKNQASSDPPF